ncbi:MAG: hypothetical protein OEZ22_04725 [Spirochaetia bacterium]|nr:hypothetical protein [Spirochaetia bacterium]
MKKILVISIMLAISSHGIFAQETEEKAEAAPAASEGSSEKTMAVNVNLGGLGTGSYTVNFEKLLGGAHGIVAEGYFSGSSDGDTTSTAYGGALHYRWHFSNVMQSSGFMGIFGRYLVGNGTGKWDNSLTNQKEEFTLDYSMLWIGANFGKRWKISDSGLNAVFRIGYGYPVMYDSTTTPSNPTVDDIMDLFTGIVAYIGGVDLEVSVGYAF